MLNADVMLIKMNKNKAIIISLLLTILLGVVFAQSLGRTDASLKLSVSVTDAISDAGVKSIEITSSPITCNDKECWSKIYQEGLIDTEWRTEKATYTLNQLTELRNDYVAKRLNLYANELIKTKSKPEVILDDGGILTK